MMNYMAYFVDVSQTDSLLGLAETHIGTVFHLKFPLYC